MKTSFLLSVLGLAGLMGCGTPDHLPDYPGVTGAGTAADSTVKVAQAEGAIVSLEPFADKARCETYFDLNAPSAGIAIFHLHLENRSADTTWLLRKAYCKLLVSGQDSPLAGANTARSTASGEAMAMTGAALAGLASTPILLGLGSHEVKQASTVQRNFTEKELGDRTLSPGQATQGFVYYQMPKKKASFQGTYQVSLINTRNQQTNTLQIPIDYEIK